MNIRNYIPMLVQARRRRLENEERARVDGHKLRLARLTTSELEQRAQEGGLGEEEKVAMAELLHERGRL